MSTENRSFGKVLLVQIVANFDTAISGLHGTFGFWLKIKLSLLFSVRVCYRSGDREDENLPATIPVEIVTENRLGNKTDFLHGL